MRNVYVVRLNGPVTIEPCIPHFGSKTTSSLYVVSSSFTAAQEAVLKKYPVASVRGIDMLNYGSVPIVIGD